MQCLASQRIDQARLWMADGFNRCRPCIGPVGCRLKSLNDEAAAADASRPALACFGLAAITRRCGIFGVPDATRSGWPYVRAASHQASAAECAADQRVSDGRLDRLKSSASVLIAFTAAARRECPIAKPELRFRSRASPRIMSQAASAPQSSAWRSTMTAYLASTKSLIEHHKTNEHAVSVSS